MSQALPQTAPAELLRDEMIERDWTEEHLAKLLGWDVRRVQRTLSGQLGFTRLTCREIGGVLSTGEEVWRRLAKPEEAPA